MGFDPVTAGLIMGGIGAASSFSQSMQQKGQQKAQASALERQAQLQRIEGEREAEKIDRQKIQLTRQFNELQAHNAVSLGMGNVDASSGSAEAVAQGNINRYASDVGENAYERAMSIWATNEKVKQTQAQADYMNKTADSYGDTLLGSLIAGGSGFLSGYGMAGGKLFGGSEKTTLWDKTKNGVLTEMRHPSGKKWAMIKG